MLLRLAFAISTAYTREILLIDEVIGAGDAEFMGRARQRLNDLAQRSAIVVVASHNPAALRDMCSIGVVMDGGRIRFHGPIDDAQAFYTEEIQRGPANRRIAAATPAAVAPPPVSPAPAERASSEPQPGAAEAARRSGTAP
jgi:ABC-type sulfate/molybdate transport systems ATPase subunit